MRRLRRRLAATQLKSILSDPTELLLAGFLCRPVSFQFGRQFRSSCSAHGLCLGGSSRTCRRFNPANPRPPRLLSRGNLSFDGRAHASMIVGGGAISGIAEYPGKLSVERCDSFLDGSRAPQLFCCKVEYIHSESKPSRQIKIKRTRDKRPGAGANSFLPISPPPWATSR